MVAVVAGLLLQGCAAPGADIDSAPDEDAAVAPVKRLNPPLAVDQPRDMGRSFEAVLAEVVEGREPMAKQRIDGCAWSVYAVGEWAEVAHWDCPNDERILTFSRDGGVDDEVIVDRNYDGMVDAVMHRERQLPIWRVDDNDDGRVDREAVDYALVSESTTMDGYPANCLPPTQPALRIRTDSDHDGYFDREGLTASDDPHGNMIDGWVCE